MPTRRGRFGAWKARNSFQVENDFLSRACGDLSSLLETVEAGDNEASVAAVERLQRKFCRGSSGEQDADLGAQLEALRQELLGGGEGAATLLGKTIDRFDQSMIESDEIFASSSATALCKRSSSS